MAEAETTPVEELYNRLKDLPEGPDRDAFYYLIFARAASALENHELGSERLALSMGEAWNEATNSMQKLAKKEPQKALDLALKLALLPRFEGKEEEVYKWIRIDGPISLTITELRKPFLDYLKTDPKAGELIRKTGDYMRYDFSKISSANEAFHDPNCFLAVATMFLGSQYRDSKENINAQSLSQTAMNKLADPNAQRVIRYYRDIEDTAWIVEALEPYLSKS